MGGPWVTEIVRYTTTEAIEERFIKLENIRVFFYVILQKQQAQKQVVTLSVVVEPWFAEEDYGFTTTPSPCDFSFSVENVSVRRRSPFTGFVPRTLSLAIGANSIFTVTSRHAMCTDISNSYATIG